MATPRVIVLGGGLAGMAAAYALARAGWARVTVVERGATLGGLAGTFETNGHFYPLAYHHILQRDQGLLFFLDAIGALPDVRWRKIAMLFELHRHLYDLAHPIDFLRFPMSLGDKLRFVRLMLRCYGKSDWSDWNDRSAADLVDEWGGPGVRQAIFDPLTRLKFNRPCHDVSGAWLGARLHFREGMAPLGYIPGTNWTKVLCEGVTRLLADAAVDVRPSTSVRSLVAEDDRVTHVELDTGGRLEADIIVSTVPTEVYQEIVATPRPDLDHVRYTAVVSAMFATKQPVTPTFYWMNLASLDCTASGMFMLNALNPTIGAPGDTCLNVMTHVPSRHDAFFRQSDDEILGGYLADFHRVFGFELDPFWTQVNRLALYAPVFHRGYQNPPLRDAVFSNVYCAGNYRTFPSIASTGTALSSGVEAAAAVLADHDATTDLPGRIERYRLASRPRG
ncbi:MAG: FAD-dependent oxidoreductase [Acidobacteria bacterium]|nr:FAD-dependent oxidoreductase [Acidobacteriota bacterium]